MTLALTTKEYQFNLQNKQCKSRPFWIATVERGCLAWLPRMIFHSILPGQTHVYSIVIFPAAFIFPAYEGDSALNHMLMWYKVVSVIGQSKFEV